MSDHLCITVRWLDTRYHGLVDDGNSPEWPPSPLRCFQALLAGAKQAHWTESLASSFRWFEGACERRPPVIVAPVAKSGSPYTLFVPNNDTDKPADAQRAAKIVRPTILPEDSAVHYLWPVSPDEHGQAGRIARSARHLTALGWGIDLAVADGQIINASAAAHLAGIHWKPLAADVFAGHPMRVPITGTLARLELVYESFLNRLGDGISRPPLPFKTYNVVSYCRSDFPLARPAVLFKLVNADNKMDSHPHARLIHVAAWVRHAAIELTRTNSRLRDLTEFVSGHGDRSQSDYRQLSYLPLQSIGHEHTDPDIRRVLIAEPAGSSGEGLRRIAPYLHGIMLKPEADDKAQGNRTLRLILIEPDGVARCYLSTGQKWASVTPVILPGHDDHKSEKTVKLIRRALEQSGIDQPCQFEWDAISSFKHSLSAHKYDRNGSHMGYRRPDHLKNLTAVHLRLNFEHPFTGPLAIGGGRHCGLGVFARVES